MKLYLSWWWDHQQNIEFDKIFKKELQNTNKKILCIFWAKELDKQHKSLEWMNEWYYEYNLFSILDQTIDIDYKNFDALYIWWWNTFRLQKRIRENNAAGLIQYFMDNNKPIYWGSAWAMIFWYDIHCYKWDFNCYSLDLEACKWLNLLNNNSIYPHYINWKLDWMINEYCINYKVWVIWIPEWEWIIVSDNGIEYIWNWIQNFDIIQ